MFFFVCFVVACKEQSRTPLKNGNKVWRKRIKWKGIRGKERERDGLAASHTQ